MSTRSRTPLSVVVALVAALVTVLGLAGCAGQPPAAADTAAPGSGSSAAATDPSSGSSVAGSASSSAAEPWAGSSRGTGRAWDAAAGVRVVTIGDSITGGHGLTTAQAWPALVADEQGWSLTNLSCDGAGVAAIGDDDDCASAYPDLVERAVGLRPSVVVVQASSNDLGLDTAEIRSATDQVVADVHRRMPHARLIGLSAIWGEDAPPAQLAAISTAMRTALRREGGTFVDVGQPLRGHADWMQSDDVHPTARGQRAVAAAVTHAFTRDHVRF